MRVIGIDPGLAATGWAVVERGRGRPRAVGHGVVKTAPDATPRRLAALRDELGRVFDSLEPEAAAIERVFFNLNVRTAMSVGQASGIALLVAAERGLEVFDYTPTEVKMAVSGSGAATKAQVQAMVRAIVGAPAAFARDAADGCALALCHLHREGLRQAVSAAGRAR